MRGIIYFAGLVIALCLAGGISRADITTDDRDKIAGLFIAVHSVEINEITEQWGAKRSFVLIRNQAGIITDWQHFKRVRFSLSNEMFWENKGRVYRVRFERLTVSRTTFDIEIKERDIWPLRNRVSVFLTPK